MINAKQAWGLLAAGVVIYEVTCDDGELLSEQADRWLVSNPILTRAVIAAVALHLANLLPWYADPLGKRVWRKIFG